MEKSHSGWVLDSDIQASIKDGQPEKVVTAVPAGALIAAEDGQVI